MKRLALLALLLACLWPLTSGSAPSTGNFGGGLSSSGDVTIGGTVTADGFDSPPDDPEGGSIVLKECEQATVPVGTNCPAAGAGHSLTIKLPDDANPLNTNKVYSPGYQLSVAASQTNFNTQEDGNYCIGTSAGSAPQACYDAAAAHNAAPYVGGPFLDGVFVDKCLVMVSDSDGFTAGDVLKLQMVAIDTSTVNHATYDEIGDTWTYIDAAATCGNLAPNCKLDTEDSGTFAWQVHVDEADCNNADDPYDCCTAAATGPDCAATNTYSVGQVGVSIHADSNDADANAELRIRVLCTYF